jgi:hypothetical protein
MTPKIIELEQAPVVLVELNCYFSNPDTIGIGNDETYTYMRELSTGKSIALGVNLKVLGALSDLTEEQFAECVDSDGHYGVMMFRNYKQTSMPLYDEQISVIESFYSLLESEKVYTENPCGTEKPEPCYKVLWDAEGDELVEEWEEAQKRTIDPSRTIILLKS